MIIRSGYNSSGYTLIELMVVICIVGILSAMAIAAYKTYLDKAKIACVLSDLREIRLAMEMLATDTETWPGPNNVGVTANLEVWDLNAANAGLVATNGAFPKWNGPYLDSVPQDPWGNNYFFDPDYRVDGQNEVVLGSFGPNGVGRNQYDSDDVLLVLPPY